MKKIGIVAGSARKGAFSALLAENVGALLPEGFAPVIIPIGDLPLYNQDIDAEGRTPDSWKAFRRTVASMDAFIFVTPEHNRSFPAALKNALDIASRPWGQNVWAAKPGAVVSVTPGGLGAFGANHHLRQVLSFLNVPTMAQPEAYISQVMDILDENGRVKDGEVRDFLKTFGQAFSDFVSKF